MITLQASKNKFLVVGVDTFDNDSWIHGEFNSLEEATKVATENSGQMTKMYIYNDTGKCLGNFGTF